MLKTITCISVALFMFACSPKKSSNNPAPAAAESAEADQFSTAGMEYCSDDAATNCFLEARDGGRSEFYTIKEQEGYWTTREGLAGLGVKFILLTKEEYDLKSVQEVYPRATYSSSVNLNMDVADADGNVKLPFRGGAAGASKIPSLKAGKFFSDIGKKFKRRPGETTGKGSRIGFKAIFGTFGAAALLPLVQSIWDTFSPDKNGRLVKPSSIDVKMNWQGDSITDVIE